MPNKHFKKSGFTMIETLVAIGLFGIVISIAVGGFVRALRAHSQVVALVAANTNASLTIEQIAREIRTGYEFSCEPQPNCNLSFKDAEGESVVYGFFEEVGQGWIGRQMNGGSFEKMTADNIDVEYMRFKLLGEREGDGFPPRITISLGIAPSKKTIDTAPTTIQTTISARQFLD